jgi:hypothetical protein
MNLEIKGGFSKQRTLAEDAVRWYAKKYMPRIRNLDVNVSIRTLEENYCGFCHENDTRDFTIEVNRKLDTFDFVTTVIHEMIHVKQYVKRELVDDHEKGRTRWKSRTYSFEMEYDDQPWEKEAHRWDEIIASEFMCEVYGW